MPKTQNPLKPRGCNGVDEPPSPVLGLIVLPLGKFKSLI